MNRKLQLAGPGATRAGATRAGATRSGGARGETLLYSGVAFGVLVGAAISTYVWRQRVKAENLLNLTPLERAEKLIEACESKLDSIEKTVRSLQEK